MVVEGAGVGEEEPATLPFKVVLPKDISNVH